MELMTQIELERRLQAVEQALARTNRVVARPAVGGGGGIGIQHYDAFPQTGVGAASNSQTVIIERAGLLWHSTQQDDAWFLLTTADTDLDGTVGT